MGGKVYVLILFGLYIGDGVGVFFDEEIEFFFIWDVYGGELCVEFVVSLVIIFGGFLVVWRLGDVVYV